MTTAASDNPFPKIIGVEQGSDPATPPAGQRKLYAKAGGWYDKNSAGVVTGPLGAGGGGSAPVGKVLSAFPAGIAPGLPQSTTYDNAASRARLYPITITGSMLLRRLGAAIQATGAGTYQWGLFDYSTDATSCTKLAGGSGTFSATGWASIAAGSAPVSIAQGNYALILLAPASGFANIYRTNSTGSGGESWHKYRDGWTWDDTPDLTTGWSVSQTAPILGLFGDLDATHQW